MISVKLKDVALNITDGKHGDCEGEANSGYYFISCKDVSGGIIHYNDARQITEKDFIETNKRTMLEPNDILITNSGTIGRMALVKNIPQTYKTTFQKSVAIVKPNQDIVRPTYLYYVLNNCVKRFINESNGSAQKNLLLGTMREFSLDIEEDFYKQDKICNILQPYDDLIENNQKQIKLLEETTQRLYKEWFVELKFPAYEDCRIINGVPEAWEKTTLDSICELRKEVLKPEKITKGMPYIGLEHMPRKDFCLSEWGDSGEVKSNKYQCYEDDVLFGKIRPYFHKVGFALVDCICSTDAIVMKAKNGMWGLLLALVSSKDFVDYTYQTCKEGAKMPRADWNEMKKYPVLIASEAVQKDFEEKIWTITREIKTLAIQNRKLKEARDRLLPKLISGEIEV